MTRSAPQPSAQSGQAAGCNRVTDVTHSAGDGGADLLDRVEAFLAAFIAYPSEGARVAHTLWIAHTHNMDAWESTPRIAFLSPEPASGKSRALEVTELLVPRPVQTVNTSPAYIFRKVSDEDGLPTILYDEIDTVFGPRAKDNEDIRGLLNAGHRKGAVAGRCKVVGKQILTEELPAYAAVALAGLNDLPDTLMSRSVVVRMRPRAPHETVEAFRHRLHADEGHALRDELAEWAPTIPAGVWPDMPAEIADRDADVWEALLCVADAAGGGWPLRARVTAVTLVTQSKEGAPSLGVRLLEDLRTVFDDRESIATTDLLDALHALEDSPWGELRGKPIDARWLSRHLAKYEVERTTIRIGDKVVKGYRRSDLVDPWSRYLGSSEPTREPSADSVTSVTRLQHDADLYARTKAVLALPDTERVQAWAQLEAEQRNGHSDDDPFAGYTDADLDAIANSIEEAA
jgi:hypothetical protein